MKKIFLLFFLTIVSLGYSQVVDYCATPRASTNHGGSYLLNYTSRNVSGTTYEMKLEFANVTSGAANANIGANPGGVNVAANPVWSNGNQTLTYQFTASSTPTLYVATIFVVINGIEVRWDLPTNSNFAAVCSSGGGQDTEAPTNFTASLGTITSNSVELLLDGEDNSGAVTYNISYGSGSASTTGVSGVQKSFIVSGLTSDTLYNFSIQASDAAGNNATNNPIVLPATTLENTNTNCSGQSTEASQESFTTGYNYNFSTSGSDVTVEFELLDNKNGVVTYVWNYSGTPFESPMTFVSGRKFTKTFTGQTIGSTFSFACKFAFEGGMAVTKIFDYTVGDNCGGGGTLLNPSFEPWSIASKQVGDADFEITPPISTSSGAFTYFSSNTAVATINGNEIQIVGVGTTTITANQAATEEYNAGSATATFTVTVPPLAVAAPTPPARNAWDVVSFYSDAYTSIANTTWSGQATISDVSLEGNATKYLADYIIAGIGSSNTDVSTMTTLHVDIYTPDSPTTWIRLNNVQYVATTAINGWRSFDIPLSSFSGAPLTAINNIQFVSPTGAVTPLKNLYIDNIYFYRSATLLTPTITDFTVPTKALGDASFALTAPISNSSGAFTYTSSNESVATINGNMVTIVGTGTTTITATQAAAGDYDTGSITADFQVTVPIIPVSITSPSCGSILNYRNAPISCNAVSVEGHTVQYRFRIQNENFNASVLRDVPNFTILQASYAAYVHPPASTYSVYVSLVVNGEQQPESQVACSISVPAVALPTQGLQNCDTVLTTPSTLVFGPSVSGAVEYQFEISLGGNVVTTLTRPSNYFHSSTNFTEWNYGTTYTVKMKARKSNETFDQLAFGTACNLTYPAIPAQTQALVNCSNTLSTVSTLVFTPSVFGATSYRFELNDGSTTYTVTRPNAYFHFTTDFPEWNYGKTYSVKVQVARNNNEDYGPLSTNACTLTSPAMPTPAQGLVNCATVMTSPNSLLFAPSVFGATNYQFVVTIPGTYYAQFEKNVPYFRLSDVEGWIAGTTYNVTVKAFRNGVESGTSTSCSFTTPGTTPVARIAQVPFAVKAYPNPYSNAFQLDVTSTDKTASIDVKVFDMLGRMVDSKNTTAGDLETATIGSDYPSGVYNVIVTQGEETKVVRVVKR